MTANGLIAASAMMTLIQTKTGGPSARREKDETMTPNADPGRAPPIHCLEESDAVESRLVAGLTDRRFRAYRTVQNSVGVVRARSDGDHALIHRLAGTGYRHDGTRRTGRTDAAAPTTLLPAGHPTDWDLSEGIDILQIPVADALLRRHAVQEFDINPDRLDLRERVGVADPFMAHFAPLVLRELASEHPGSPLLYDGLMALASGHILRSYSNISEVVVARAETALERGDRDAVRRTVEMLLDDLQRNMSTDDIAEAIGINPFRLMRAFKAEMGVSIHRFLLENRVAMVRDRLLNTDDRLIDIALDAGFANQSHMTSVYTSLMGVSPGRHRRRMRH
ncbi:MAG: AraC family transcriptional regulator [Pseudomonadota bacterium]